MASIKPTWSLDGALAFAGVGYSDQGNLFASDGFYTIYNPFIGKATLDLTDKHGAYVMPRIGKLRNTTFTVSPKFRIFRHADAAGVRFSPTPFYETEITTDTAVWDNIITDAMAGDTIIDVVTGASFAAGDVILISTVGINKEEWNRIVRVVGDLLHLEFPLRFDHDGDVDQEGVHNKVIAPAPIWLPGGGFYEFHVVNNVEVIAGGGEADEDGALRVQVGYHTYDEDTAV